ncbi:MAG: ABC-type transport auxiliary lipoprotein family protein [Lysobacteraceae bacterium]
MTATWNRGSATTSKAAALAASLFALALPGCALVGGARVPATVYAPEPAVQADPAWPRADWQLAIARPEASRLLDGTRIAVRPTPGELQVYKGASWARSPADQLENAVLHSLEDAGTPRAVARQGSGIAADYTLVMELRRFEAEYAGAPMPDAVVEVSAKLLSTRDQGVVASRTFLQRVQAPATDTATVAATLGHALAQVAHDIDGWVLASGNAAARPGGAR